MTAPHKSPSSNISLFGTKSLAFAKSTWLVLRQQVFEETPVSLHAEWRSFTIVDSIEDLACGSLGLWAAAKGGVIHLRSKDEAIIVRRYGSEHGLPGSHFDLVVIDPFERPWIRSSQGCLSYLSGHTWYRMTAESGLPSNLVSCAHLDKKGRLWVGTDKGLGHFQFNVDEDPIWDDYDLSKLQLPSLEVLSVDVSPSGHLALGTPWGLYAQDKNKEWYRYTTLDGLASIEVSQVKFINDTDLWVGTAAGLVRIVEGATSHVQLSHEPIKRIVRSHDGSHFWFVTSRGLWHHNNGNLELTSVPPNFTAVTRPTSVTTDPAGKVYIGLDRGLVEYHPLRRVILEYDKEGVSDEPVTSIVVDKVGQVWMGSASGVSLLRNDHWRFFAESSATVHPIRNVSDIQLDPKGAIWVGSWEGGHWGGLRVASSYRNFRKVKGEGVPESVDAVLVQNDSSAYVASGSGIWLYDGHLWSLIVESPDSSSIISSLLVVNDTLWCGCSSGLFRRASGAWHTVSEAGVNCLSLDNRGTIWVGTEAGLYSVEKMVCSQHTLALDSQHINVALATEPNGIWLGTDRELALLGPGGQLSKWNVFDSGLPHDQILALSFDDERKRLWIGTGNGVALLSPQI